MNEQPNDPVVITRQQWQGVQTQLESLRAALAEARAEIKRFQSRQDSKVPDNHRQNLCCITDCPEQGTAYFDLDVGFGVLRRFFICTEHDVQRKKDPTDPPLYIDPVKIVMPIVLADPAEGIVARFDEKQKAMEEFVEGRIQAINVEDQVRRKDISRRMTALEGKLDKKQDKNPEQE